MDKQIDTLNECHGCSVAGVLRDCLGVRLLGEAVPVPAGHPVWVAVKERTLNYHKMEIYSKLCGI